MNSLIKYLVSIKNVSVYYVYDSTLYCFYTDSTLHKFNNLHEEWECQLDTQHFLGVFNKDLIYSWWQFNKLTFIDCKNGNIVLNESIPFKPLITANERILGSFLFKSDSNTEFVFGQLDEKLSQQYFTNTHNAIVILTFNDKIICQSGWDILICKNINGVDKWKININMTKDLSSSFINQRQIEMIFEYKGLIIVKIAKNLLIGVNGETGEIVWEQDFTKEHFFLTTLFEGIFYVFSDKYYEVEAKTGKIIREIEYRGLFQSNNFKPYAFTQPAISDKWIVITSQVENKILVIERANFNMFQIIELGGCVRLIPLSNLPQIHCNRLYQLDGDNRLYVFEMENAEA